MKKPTKRQLEKLLSEATTELVGAAARKEAEAEVDALKHNKRIRYCQHIDDGISALNVVTHAHSVLPDMEYEMKRAVRFIAGSLAELLNGTDGLRENS